MDYRKLGAYLAQNRVEENNIGKEIEELKKKHGDLDEKLVSKRNQTKILGALHQKIFDVTAEGGEYVTLFITLIVPNQQRTLWGSLLEAHTLLDRMLRDIGIKDVSVETVPQFRIRRPREKIPGPEHDTVISFPISHGDLVPNP